MKWRVLLRVDDPEAARGALTAAGVRHQIDAVRLDEATKPGAQEHSVASTIYEGLRDGDTYMAVARRTGVSYHTVLRLAKNPRKYGIDADPIRRRGSNGTISGSMGRAG
jgi:hypothetical protein